ncbi:hypothetical protein [Specibacter sp. NPDC078692]|uniref:hypothetical protein n=1 Tax=Specibacter sp. NPDC078692 TaxID=3155818 RepID=UPI0034345C8B
MNLEDRIKGLGHQLDTGRYVTWHRDELELRSFLLASSEGMTSWFKGQEEAATIEVQGTFDPQASHGDEGYNLFMDRVGIFWEQYWYQLAAAVIKDSFTLYEVFLEESAHETLRWYGAGLLKQATEDSWRANECEDFYKAYLGVDIKHEDIDDIRWIRNKLSHLRDSLRTTAGKSEFEEKIQSLGIGADATESEKELGLPHYDYGRDLALGSSLSLTPLEAWRILDILRMHIERLTQFLNKLQYGRYTTQALADLSEGWVLKEKDRKILRVPNPEPKVNVGSRAV